MSPFLIHALIVFIAAVVADICWGRYTIHMSRKHRHRASLWSVGIAINGLVGTVSVVENHLYVIPFAVGCYLGTFLAAGRPDTEA